MQKLYADFHPFGENTWNGTEWEQVLSVTVPAGQNFIVLAVIISSTNPVESLDPDEYVARLNGSKMTQATLAGDGNFWGTSIYYIPAPAAGTYDLVYTYGNARKDACFLVESVDGVSGVADSGSVGDWLSNATVTLNTASGDQLIDIITSTNDTTQAAGQTLLHDFSLELSEYGKSSQKTADSASTDMTWTQTAGRVAQSAIAFTSGGAAETVTSVATDITHGQVIPLVSSITDANAVNFVDSGDNVLAGTNLVVGSLSGDDRNYQITVPALAGSLQGLLPDTNWTVEITNGTDTATLQLPRTVVSGFSELVATTQAGTITIDDWSYGFDNPVVASDILWHPTVAGFTFNADGTVSIDTETFTGGTVVFWVQDLTDRRWSRVTKIYDEEGNAVSTEVAAVLQPVLLDILTDTIK